MASMMSAKKCTVIAQQIVRRNPSERLRLISTGSFAISRSRLPSKPIACRFSTESSYSPVNWWRNRQEGKEAEKYKERLQFMATKEDWTIGDMKEELDEVALSWTAKMPVVGSSKEITVAKKMHKTVESLGNVIGLDANLDTLATMKRSDKLKAAISSESTLEDVNILIQQFEGISMMHKVLRQRFLDGKKIPETAEAIQAIMQVEGQQVLTKAQKTKMMGRSRDMIRKSRRR